MARCSHSKQSFGIRMEEKIVDNWAADWAFPMKESVAKKEGYDNTQITGSFSVDESYPGCPYCERKTFCRCGSCSKVSCSGGQGSTHNCPWCGTQAKIEGYIQSLNAGTDR